MDEQHTSTWFELDDKSERKLSKVTTKLQKHHNLSSADALDVILLMGMLNVPELEPEDKSKVKRTLDEVLVRSSRSDEEGYVYILKVEGKDIFKVGITRGDPFYRVKTIQSGCPYKLGVYAFMSCHDCRAKEVELCSILNRYCMRGEWFGVSQDIIDELIVQEIVRVELSKGAYTNPTWISTRAEIGERRDEIFDRLGIPTQENGGS